MSFATEEFKEHLRSTHLRPAFQRDVEDFTGTRFANRKWGERLELLANICTALAMGSVSVGLWSDTASRPCMLTSLLLKASNLTLLTVANVLKKRASRSTDQLNHTLRTIGIDTHVPNVSDHDLSSAKNNEEHPPVVHE